MPNKGWSRDFDDPIPLPEGGELRTLRDAGNFIAKLPNRGAPAWLAAIQALMLAVKNGGDTMLPRIGIMRALYPGETPHRRRGRSWRGNIGLQNKDLFGSFASYNGTRRLRHRLLQLSMWLP